MQWRARQRFSHFTPVRSIMYFTWTDGTSAVDTVYAARASNAPAAPLVTTLETLIVG